MRKFRPLEVTHILSERIWVMAGDEAETETQNNYSFCSLTSLLCHNLATLSLLENKEVFNKFSNLNISISFLHLLYQTIDKNKYNCSPMYPVSAVARQRAHTVLWPWPGHRPSPARASQTSHLCATMTGTILNTENADSLSCQFSWTIIYLHSIHTVLSKDDCSNVTVSAFQIKINEEIFFKKAPHEGTCSSPRFKSWFSTLVIHVRKQWMTAQVFGPAPVWETWEELLAPDFGLAQPHLLQPCG